MTHGEQMAERIANLHPCKEAIDWLVQQKSPTQSWRDCQHGDWMIWLIGSQIKSPPWSDDRKPLLACCLDVAEIAKHLWPKDQAGKIANAIGVLRAWIDAKATAEEAKQAKSDLNAAAYAAYAADAADAANAANAAAYAAYAAYAADAADAANAANAAANAANAAAYAANAATYAAYAAAYAANAAANAATYAAYAAADAADAAAYATRTETLSRAADIVRQHYPKPPTITR